MGTTNAHRGSVGGGLLIFFRLPPPSLTLSYPFPWAFVVPDFWWSAAPAVYLFEGGAAGVANKWKSSMNDFPESFRNDDRNK